MAKLAFVSAVFEQRALQQQPRPADLSELRQFLRSWKEKCQNLAKIQDEIVSRKSKRNKKQYSKE